ncbi:hypothetical protein [Thermophagus xiamenensis]|uniref:Amidohydrolase family protein n=1 Tax=Thermophagus xiamenensis TaxID=385682 RepID=A0A1I1UQ06_9BACT|nr:hypothetical protein [Thermophagus xiamenensis]SFD72867.1 hypothetical protein SAMN05444380_101159 [Thermophagus xiamenensis]
MKLIRRITITAGILIGSLIIILTVILTADRIKTDYLRKKRSEYNSQDSYVIKNIQLIPMTADTVLTGKIVHIKKGIIHAIYDSTNWNISNEKLTVVDGQNGFLLPGLTDMHVHLWDRYELGLYLANGVTTIRNVWGLPFHLRLKKTNSKKQTYWSTVFYYRT